jgi:hypothetical protein
MGDDFSHPYRTNDKIVVLYIFLLAAYIGGE